MSTSKLANRCLAPVMLNGRVNVPATEEWDNNRALNLGSWWEDWARRYPASDARCHGYVDVYQARHATDFHQILSEMLVPEETTLCGSYLRKQLFRAGECYSPLQYGALRRDANECKAFAQSGAWNYVPVVLWYEVVVFARLALLPDGEAVSEFEQPGDSFMLFPAGCRILLCKPF